MGNWALLLLRIKKWERNTVAHLNRIRIEIGFPECCTSSLYNGHNNACDRLCFWENGVYPLASSPPDQWHALNFSLFYLFLLFVSMSLQRYLLEIELIQSLQSLEVNRPNRILYESEASESLVRSHGNGIQSIFAEKNVSIRTKRFIRFD